MAGPKLTKQHLPSLNEIPLNKNEKSFIFAHVAAEIRVVANNLIKSPYRANFYYLLADLLWTPGESFLFVFCL